MKKQIMIISTMVCIVGVILIILLWKNAIINLDFSKDGKIIFCYNDLNINKSCTEEELLTIYDIFNGKLLYEDNPSCGFSDEISIKLGDEQTFCLACDSCPIIYWKEKEKYFSVSEEEMEQLHKIFEQYDAEFPCI